MPLIDLYRALDAERLHQLEGSGSASKSIEAETLAAIREAEKVQRQALGMREEM